MQLVHATVADCHLARDTAVVMDVIRAFTGAAFAFAAGVVEILPVSPVAETVDTTAYLNQVRTIGNGRLANAPASATIALKAVFLADIKCCVALDRFDFAMQIQPRNELLVMEPVRL